MKNYTRIFLATTIFLGVAIFLAPFAANAAGSPSGLLTFVAPSAGEQILVGKPYDIKWTGPVKWIVSPGTTDAIRNVRLTMVCGDPSKGATRNTIITASTKNDGLFKWSVPKTLPANNYCKITIASDNGKYYDVSPVFGIVTSTPPPTPVLNASCSASPNPANTNQSVTFASLVSGGTGSYSYSWSGACTSTTANCNNSFSSSGNYSASLSVTSGTQTKSASCSVVVNAPIPVGNLTLAKYSAYTDQTTTAPVANYKIAHFTSTVDPTEDININTIEADLNSISSSVTNLYVKYGTQTTSVKATASATNTWSVNYKLSAGQTIDVMVYGDINSSASGTGQASVLVSGMGAVSAKSISTNNGSPLAGQTITIGSGSFVGTQDPATPVTEIVAGGQPVTVGIFKFTAQNDSYTIGELKFAVGSSNSTGTATAANAIASASLRDNATGATLATTPVQLLGGSYVAYFTGLSATLPANTTKSLAVVLNLSSTVSADTDTTNIDVEPYLSYVKVFNSQGVQSNSNTTPSLLNIKNVNPTYVFKAIPTITYAGADSHASTGSSVELYKFAISSGTTGEVAVKQLKFIISANNTNSDNPYLNNFKLFKNGTDITSSVAILNNSGSSLTSTNAIGSGMVIVAFNTEEIIPAGTTMTYALKATVNNFSTTPASGADAIATYMPYDPATSTQTTSYGGSYLRDSDSNGIYGLASTATGTSTETYNMLWSDASAASPTIHDCTNGSASYDWYDGYLISTTNSSLENVVAQ